MTASGTHDQPRERSLSPAVACTLRDADLGAQAKRWQRLGDASGGGRVETEDGVRLSFRDDPSVEEELRALVSVESDCCAWARWEVRREDGELALHVSSTKEGVAALQAMFGHSASRWAVPGSSP